VIERRTFLAGTGAALLAAPHPAEAQPTGKVPRIELLFANTPQAEITGAQPASPYARAFLEGMRDLGWVDGQNIMIERRSAEGRPDRYAALVQELIGLHLDLLVTTSPFYVVQQVGGRVPVVLAGGDTDDYLRQGWVKGLARPGGNVTGLTISPGLSLRDKHVQLLMEAVRNVSRVAYLGAPLAFDAPPEAAARALNLTLLPVLHPRNLKRPSPPSGIIARARSSSAALGSSGAIGSRSSSSPPGNVFLPCIPIVSLRSRGA
jgi:putative tryptophan/tyrosine transport system substrate-binding protein